jgi:hypothetical protein
VRRGKSKRSGGVRELSCEIAKAKKMRTERCREVILALDKDGGPSGMGRPARLLQHTHGLMKAVA